MNSPFEYKPEDAFYGPVGAIVKRLTPCVPMNSLALYCELLVAIGTLVGRRAVVRYIEDDHHANLFLVMVGKTGIGKGTSWNVIRRVIHQIDPGFSSLVSTDSASAPGLIALVRDPSVKTVNGKVVEDKGVKDKRRLVVFEEMETLFAAMERRGSTLDQIWRMAWAGSTLENNTRIQERATNPHISAICHITPEVFATHLRRRSGYVIGGFVNRFLLVPVKRERRIHRSGQLPCVTDLADQIRAAMNSIGTADPATPATEICWADECHSEWDAFCDAIDDDESFLGGVEQANGRLKPQTMRVAMLLAVIDGDQMIRLRHLRAAKALCLQLVDASRQFLTEMPGRRAATAAERIRVFQPEGDDFGLTDLQFWIKNKLRKDAIPSNEELHRLIDELVSEGVWAVVHRTDYERHRGWRFAVRRHTCDPATAKPQAGTPHPDVSEGESQSDIDDTDVECHGYSFSLGQRFTVPRDVDALTILDRPTHLKGGAIAYLIQNPTAAGADTTALDALSQKKPNHRLVYSDGALFLLPLKLATKWANEPSKRDSTADPDSESDELSWERDSRLLITS